MGRKKIIQPWYMIFMILTILFSALAILTTIPYPNASKVCILGYKAHCSFTPYATIICLVIAGIFCVIRARLFKKRAR